MCNARKLDIFAELTVGPNQIRAGDSDEVTKGCLQCHGAATEVRFRVRVTIMF